MGGKASSSASCESVGSGAFATNDGVDSDGVCFDVMCIPQTSLIP